MRGSYLSAVALAKAEALDRGPIFTPYQAMVIILILDNEAEGEFRGKINKISQFYLGFGAGPVGGIGVRVRIERRISEV